MLSKSAGSQFPEPSVTQYCPTEKMTFEIKTIPKIFPPPKVIGYDNTEIWSTDLASNKKLAKKQQGFW